MNTNPTDHTTAIIVSDVQIAIKANRHANAGFMFYALGSPIINIKFDLILFACNASTHVAKEWTKNITETCLIKGGKILGYIPPGMTMDEIVHPPKTKVDPEEAQKEMKVQTDELVALAEELDPQKKATK